MILRYLSVLGEAPLAFIVLLAAFGTALLVGLVFHEFCHGIVADRLGDPTPRRAGRLTLHPLPHLDPLGSTMIFFIGFGWAKPVPVNPNYTANPKQAMTLISAAGPLSNLVMAGLAGIPIKLGLVEFFHPFISPGAAGFAAQVWTDSAGNLLGLFLGTVVLLNVLLAVFNFIPLAPLDGFRFAVGILPRELSMQLAQLEPWSPGILLLLILMPFITGGEFNPLFTVMDPPIQLLLEIFVGDAGGLRVA